VFSELPNYPALDALDTELELTLAAIPQVLIKWTGLTADQATWEDWEVLKARFPAVLAWGQASVSPGGIVTMATGVP
jgi:hypothetical protein